MLLEYRDLYAGGRLVGSGSADVITIVNPATEEVAGAVPSMVARDVDVAVAAARQAFDAGPWPQVSPADRAAALDRLAAALEARAEDTARLVTAEMGMPITLSRRNNVSIPCGIIRYYATLARDLRTEEYREAVSFAGRTMIRREPTGVAAVIASWSYPLILAFCQLAPALAAGCTIVLKPAAETSLSGYILAEAFEAADFPPGVFNLVTGTDQVGEMLAAHPGVDTVAVAGPTTSGRRIAAICGETLKPVTLELGGKSAAIVLDDVDLDAAAADLGCLCFANSGQACFTMSRVLAPRALYGEAVQALAGQACALVVGDPMAEETTMGPLASPRQRASVETCVTAGVSAGARVVAGGRRPATPVRGYYYEPTVFADATAGMAIARDEICGPVVTVIPYDDESEAVAIANDSSYGLAGSVWTDDPERGLTIARRARVGTFGVNLYVPDIGAPWGGRKASGMGSVYGPEGLDTYLATKCVFLPAVPTVTEAGAVAAGFGRLAVKLSRALSPPILSVLFSYAAILSSDISGVDHDRGQERSPFGPSWPGSWNWPELATIMKQPGVQSANVEGVDLVLRGGRVVDPESGLDAVRDVAVSGGRVAEIGNSLAPGAPEVDVGGLVVTAGFIDLHSHVNTVAGLWLQAMDGVTTALELEAGVTPVAAAYRMAAAEGRPVNYGFAASWAMARMEAVAGIEPEANLSAFLANIASPGWQRPAAPAQVATMLGRLSADLADGALGIGLLLGYAPASSPDEYLQVCELAAEAGAPTFTHARDLIETVPQAPIDGAEEIVRAAGQTGAHMHYCHVNSTSQRHIDRVLALVGRAQAAGSRITTEAYPYGSGMTAIGAAFLAPERLGERELSPSSLIYAPTGERVASLDRLRELRRADPGGLAIIELLREDDPGDRELLMRSLTFPGSIVASDAMPLTWTRPDPARPASPAAAGPTWPLPRTAITHPRTAGTFSRALRLLTRDSGSFTLAEALAKCSLRPAQVLQDRVPALRRKGRLRVGADADIVVFDPGTITDRASYDDSTRPSAGIRHVLVNGTFVVRDGDIVADTRPGRAVRADPR